MRTLLVAASLVATAVVALTGSGIVGVSSPSTAFAQELRKDGRPCGWICKSLRQQAKQKQVRQKQKSAPKKQVREQRKKES